MRSMSRRVETTEREFIKDTRTVLLAMSIEISENTEVSSDVKFEKCETCKESDE